GSTRSVVANMPFSAISWRRFQRITVLVLIVAPGCRCGSVDPTKRRLQGLGLEIIGHRGVDLGGRRIIKKKLFGDEPFGITELDQVGDVGVPQAVQGEVFWQTGLPTQEREPLVHRLRRHPLPAPGQPQLLTRSGTQQGSGLLDPLAQSVDHPIELRDGQYGATPRGAAGWISRNGRGRRRTFPTPASAGSDAD